MKNFQFFDKKNEQHPLLPKMLALGNVVCREVKKLLPQSVNDPQQKEGLSPNDEDALENKIAKLGHDREKAMGILHDRTKTLEMKDDFYKQFIEATDRILETKIAGCQEYSFVTLRLLFEKIYNDETLFKELDAEVVEFEEKDHAFIRIFPKSESIDLDEESWEHNKETLSHSIIVDTWSNSFSVFPASQMRKKLDDGEYGRYSPEDVLDNTGITITKLADSLKQLKEKGELIEGIKVGGQV